MSGLDLVRFVGRDFRRSWQSILLFEVGDKFLQTWLPPPGTLVKISGWVKVPIVTATADGVLFYDSSAGESFGVRSLGHGWQEYRLYRRVPASGTIWLTVAITGIGTAQFDDLRIEVLN